MESRIAFREFGEGEPVILLHGFAGSVTHWEPLRPLLAKYYRVIIPNLTHMTLGRQKLTFSEQIDELQRFLKEQAVDGPVHVVGISYGGALSWGLASRYPSLVSRVVLINPMPPDPLKQFLWLGLRLFLSLPLNTFVLSLILRSSWGRDFLRSAAEIFRNVDHPVSLDRVQSLEGRKLLFVAHLIERFAWILKKERWHFWESQLNKWNHETFVIYEEQDPLIRYMSYEALARKLGCENSLVTQGAGHISTLNSPHMITWEVMKFLLHKNAA